MELRCWKRSFFGFLKAPKMLLIAALTAVFIFRLSDCVLENFSRRVLLESLFWLIAVAAVYFGYGAVTATIYMLKHRKLYRILDEKGFCEEYLQAFQQKYIYGKPVSYPVYIEYADIYNAMGDGRSAINILNTVNVPESDYLQRAMYIYVYMIAAMKIGDSPLADDIWRRNSNFINSNIYRPHFGLCTNALCYVMAMADAAAGRYQRSYERCCEILGSDHLKKWHETCTHDFLALKIFLIRKLGRENELNGAVDEFNAYMKKWEPLFDSERKNLRRDVERAMRGELPI